MTTNMNDLDLNKLLEEVSIEVENLIKKEKSSKKSEKSKMEESTMEKALECSEESTMKKADESSEASSPKEESSSSYSSQTPEVTSNPKESSSSHESSMPEGSSSSQESSSSHESSMPPESSQHKMAPEEEAQDLEGMLMKLNDDMLHELAQKVVAEMHSRHADESPEMPSEQSAPEHSMAPAEKTMNSQPMVAMKSEKSEDSEKLAKAEEKIQNLEKTVAGIAELFTQVVNRPVKKAISGINQIAYVDKGERELKKSEDTNINDEDLKKRLTALSNDPTKLMALTKKEADALIDYHVSKRRTPEVLELVKK